MCREMVVSTISALPEMMERVVPAPGRSVSASAPTWYLREDPAQMQPHIEQHKRQGKQHEPIRGIVRRGPAPYLASTAIAGLDAKAVPIQLPDIAGGKVQVDQDEEQPGDPALEPLGAPRRREPPTDCHCSRELPPVGTFEGMLRAVTLAPLADRPRPAGRAP